MNSCTSDVYKVHSSLGAPYVYNCNEKLFVPIRQPKINSRKDQNKRQALY